MTNNNNHISSSNLNKGRSTRFWNEPKRFNGHVGENGIVEKNEGVYVYTPNSNEYGDKPHYRH